MREELTAITCNMGTTAGQSSITGGEGCEGGPFVFMDAKSTQNAAGSGALLAHEVGHWLGLPHTFNTQCKDGGWECKECDAAQNLGDGIADTPTHKKSQACKAADTCPNLPGADPIDNVMDYSGCANARFTPGQAAKAISTVAKYYPAMVTPKPANTPAKMKCNPNFPSKTGLEQYDIQKEKKTAATDGGTTEVPDGAGQPNGRPCKSFDDCESWCCVDATDGGCVSSDGKCGAPTGTLTSSTLLTSTAAVHEEAEFTPRDPRDEDDYEKFSVHYGKERSTFWFTGADEAISGPIYDYQTLEAAIGTTRDQTDLVHLVSTLRNMYPPHHDERGKKLSHTAPEGIRETLIKLGLLPHPI